jgi:hypothetical protein
MEGLNVVGPALTKLNSNNILLKTIKNYRHASKNIIFFNAMFSQSQWPRGLRSRSAADWLLGSRVGIPLGHGYLSVVFICSVALCR